MARGARLRRIVSLTVSLTLAAVLALVFAGRLGLFHRFDLGGLKINPQAAVRDDVTYELTVWEEAWIAPWAEDTQRELLERAVREFAEQRPNVQISYVVWDEAEARTQLAAAVAAGSPPDVYGAVRDVFRGVSGQVPASPYMSVVGLGHERNEPLPYAPAAIDGLSADNAIWGWPRGLWWDAWLGRPASLADRGVNTAHLGATGWDYDTFLRIGADSAAQGSRLAVALDVTSWHVVEQLMGAAGVVGYVDDEGGVAWDEGRLIEVASFLRQLQDRGLLGKDVELMSRSRLENLYEGRVDVIGPVNPYTAQSALRRVDDELTVLPVPHPAAREPSLPVSVSAYFVFHQGETTYRGDDYTRIASELAAFLAAKSEEWLVEWIGLLPVSAAGWNVWHDRSPWNAAGRAVLEQATNNAVSAPAGTNSALSASMRTALQPLWRAFLAGEATPEQFARDALDIIERSIEGQR